MTSVLGVDPARYRSHPLHADTNDWLETNCATDMWIEVLHAQGLDPVPGLAFTVATDFGGDQWTMFTYPEEDLRLLYGIEVHELNVWRSLLEHVDEQLALGCLVAFDVDAFWLPDTRDITYRTAHQKTTLCAETVDRTGRRLGYFHNAGYAELAGADFDAVFLLGPDVSEAAAAMAPFTLQIRLDHVDPRAATPAAVRDRLAVHLDRRPVENPVSRLTKRLLADAGWLAEHDLDVFHRYAFGTCRHLGANGQLAAAFVDWLDAHDGGLGPVADAFRQVSAGAKRLEFLLARVAAGRRADIEGAMAPLADAWAAATDTLAERYGR